MEYLVDELISTEELKRAEKLYDDQMERGQPSVEAQFGYALSLVRSKGENVKKGLAILRDLLVKDEDDMAKRDYLYYLAVGNLKLKDYEGALKFVNALQRAEPSNNQAIELKEFIESKMKRDAMIGGAIIGGAALAGGAILIAGLAALVTRRSFK